MLEKLGAPSDGAPSTLMSRLANRIREVGWPRRWPVLPAGGNQHMARRYTQVFDHPPGTYHSKCGCGSCDEYRAKAAERKRRSRSAE